MGKALLITVLGLSTVFMGLMFSITASQQRSFQFIVSEYESQIARQVVESATNVALAKFYQDPGWQGGFSGSFGEASYVVNTTDITVDSVLYAKKDSITAIVTMGGISDTTIALVIQPAFSYFYFYKESPWPLELEFATGDTFPGPVYSRKRMRINGSPVFLSSVHSNASTYTAVGAANPLFYGGVELGAKDIALPDLTALTDTISTGGDVYSEELWLTFLGTSYRCSTSTVDVTHPNTAFNRTIMTTNDNNIHVKGTVDGQLTVLSDRHIIIEDDVLYASDPRTNPDSDDFLGLIARHEIQVADNIPNATNVVIHAALFAHHDEVRVINHDIGAPRGTLTILGSIAQKDYVPFGTYLGSIVLTGYALNHVYDLRLRDRTPPYYPRTDWIMQMYRSN